MNNVERLEKIRKLIGIGPGHPTQIKKQFAVRLAEVLMPDMDTANLTAKEIMGRIPGHVSQKVTDQPSVANTKNILSRLESTMLGPKPP